MLGASPHYSLVDGFVAQESVVFNFLYSWPSLAHCIGSWPNLGFEFSRGANKEMRAKSGDWLQDLSERERERVVERERLR